MNRITDVFGTSPVLLPVVHPVSREEALASVRLAHDLGVRGVFLIDQGMTEREVLRLVDTVRERYPSLWVGLNLLSRAPSEALKTALDGCGAIDGLWSDNADIDERRTRSTVQPSAEAFALARNAAGWKGLYFGGVAFKYQREVPARDLSWAATLSTPYVDVLCTSGPGTGYAADIEKVLEKVRALRAGLGDHAMALASGVTPENVRSYMPYVQAFLVGTGIERHLGVLDPAKIEALLRAMQEG